jgi:hypothetical protein
MVVAGGLFAGGAATVAWSRVPIWRRMSAGDFVRDFAQTLAWTDRVQPALLVAATASAVAVATGDSGATALLAALGAAGFALILAASVAFMVPLQRRIIATPAVEADAIDALRRVWFRGNLGRALLATLAFVAMAASAAL